MPRGWEWWLKTDAGLLARVAIGAGIFAALAVTDLLRRGRDATRWREYLFLVAAAAMALAYGAANDRIASDISWEYFYYGKGLNERLGSRTPPDAAALHREAVLLGLKATWTAGLIAGVALLLANNPRRGRRQLPHRVLVALLSAVTIAAAAGGVIGAIAGRLGLLTWTNSDLRPLVRDNLFRPRQFLTVYGQNVGGYAGGLMGTIAAVACVPRFRRSSISRPPA